MIKKNFIKKDTQKLYLDFGGILILIICISLAFNLNSSLSQGYFSNPSLKTQKSGQMPPKTSTSFCEELIPQHNKSENDRYNIVFVPIKFTDLNQFKNMATNLVDFNGTGSISSWQGQLWGMGGVEPYKSNLDKFNFWLINKNYPDDTTVDTEIPQINKCGNRPHTISVYLYDDKVGGEAGWGGITNGTIKNWVGQIGIYKKDKQNNEIDSLQYVFIHELAHFFGMDHFNIEEHPTGASTYSDAQNYWGNYIGKGCGNSNIMDCKPNCVDNNQCQPSEYETEIGIFTHKEELCFDGNNAALKNCGVLISKANTSDYHYRQISFLALKETECQTAQQNCVYIKNNHFNFFDKDNNQQFACDHEINVNVDNGKYIYGCLENNDGNYQIQRFGNMTGAKYNPLYVSYICGKMKNELGSVGETCDSNRFKINNSKVPPLAPKVKIGEPVTRN